MDDIDEVVEQLKSDLEKDRLWVLRTSTAMLIVCILTVVLLIWNS